MNDIIFKQTEYIASSRLDHLSTKQTSNLFAMAYSFGAFQQMVVVHGANLVTLIMLMNLWSIKTH